MGAAQVRLFQRLRFLGLGFLFDRFSASKSDNTVFAPGCGGKSFGRTDVHFTRVPGSATKDPVLGSFRSGKD